MVKSWGCGVSVRCPWYIWCLVMVARSSPTNYIVGWIKMVAKEVSVIRILSGFRITTAFNM